ncbi:MAG: hypothetical protein V4539_09010 [Bacteroidota bacterium]
MLFVFATELHFSTTPVVLLYLDMRYKVGKCDFFHWDGIEDLLPSVNYMVKCDFGAEVYEVANGLLPIIAQWRIRLHEDDFVPFSCIAKVKCLIEFDYGEDDPINEMVNLFEDAFKKVADDFRERIKLSVIQDCDIALIERNSTAPRSVEIIEIARQRGLIHP